MRVVVGGAGKLRLILGSNDGSLNGSLVVFCCFVCFPVVEHTNIGWDLHWDFRWD